MSCGRIQRELTGYHFGVVDDETRAELEGHLVGCADCLRSFLALKRDIETAESGPRPSPALRARLRQSVARELGLAPPRRRWSWWERPLAFGFATAAVALALLVLSVLSTSAGTMPHGLGETGSAGRAVPAQLP